jgi:hypothetical protein
VCLQSDKSAKALLYSCLALLTLLTLLLVVQNLAYQALTSYERNSNAICMDRSKQRNLLFRVLSQHHLGSNCGLPSQCLLRTMPLRKVLRIK